MSSISTFGSFTMARLGIYASQRAMDATGNNISNINTPGYTRQMIDQTSMYLDGSDRYVTKIDNRMGFGPRVTGVSQLRDPYLDIQYRNEMSNQAYMQTKYDGLGQISRILDEVGRGEDEFGVMEGQFNDLLEQMENLVTSGAGRDLNDTLVRTSASTLTDLFNHYAEQLEELHSEEEQRLTGYVDKVNNILTQIRDLNRSIRKGDIHGAPGLEQRDARNLLLDELAEYIHINVTYEKEYLGAGLSVEKLVVKVAGNDNRADPSVNGATLVDGLYATMLTMEDHPKTNADGEYLDAAGNVVETEEEAARELDDDYIVTLEELEDREGRVQELGDNPSIPDTVPSNKDMGKLRDLVTLPHVPHLTNAATAGDLQKAAQAIAQAALNGLMAGDPAKYPAEGNGVSYTLEQQDGVWYARQQLDEDTVNTINLKEAAGALPGVPDMSGVSGATGKKEMEAINQALAQAVAQAAVNGLTAADPATYPTTGGYSYEAVPEEDGSGNPAKDENGDIIWRVGQRQSNVYGSEAAAQEALSLALENGMKTTMTDVNGNIHDVKYEIVPQKDADGNEVFSIQKIEPKLSQDVTLTDNTLHGALQAQRELLTEPGEYATAAQLEADPNCATRRGIPYYQRVLDTLANKFAEVMNGANQYDDVSEIVDVATMDPDSDIMADAVFRMPDGRYIQIARQDVTDADGNKLFSYFAVSDPECYMKNDNLTPPEAPVKPVGPDKADEKYISADGSFDEKTYQADIEKYDAAMKQYEEDVEQYNTDVAAFKESLGDSVIEEEKEIGGKKVMIMTPEQKTHMLPTKDGGLGHGTTKPAVVDKDVANEKNGGGVLFSNSGDGNDPEGITAANISVSKNWAEGITRIIKSTNPNATSTDNSNLGHILSLLMSRHNFQPTDSGSGDATQADNKDVFFTGTFQEFFSNHVASTLAHDQNTTDILLNNYMVSSDELYVERDAVSGVDLNDEAMNMMQFQKSYSAACRLMTTLDEMLDKLINGTGRAGL